MVPSSLQPTALTTGSQDLAARLEEVELKPTLRAVDPHTCGAACRDRRLLSGPTGSIVSRGLQLKTLSRAGLWNVKLTQFGKASALHVPHFSETSATAFGLSWPPALAKGISPAWPAIPLRRRSCVPTLVKMLDPARLHWRAGQDGQHGRSA